MQVCQVYSADVQVKDLRALIRLQADTVNRQLVPAFYRYLQAQDPGLQIEAGKEFVLALENLAALFERSSREVEEPFGLWVENGPLGWADVMAGPCMV